MNDISFKAWRKPLNEGTKKASKDAFKKYWCAALISWALNFLEQRENRLSLG